MKAKGGPSIWWFARTGTEDLSAFVCYDHAPSSSSSSLSPLSSSSSSFSYYSFSGSTIPPVWNKWWLPMIDCFAEPVKVREKRGTSFDFHKDMPSYIKTFYESCRSKAHQVPNCWNTFKVILFHQKWNSVTNLCWNFSRRQYLRAIFFQVCKPNVIFRSPIWMSSCILEGSRCFPRKGFEWCHRIFPRRYPESSTQKV